MKPGAFDYLRADSTAEAIHFLAQYGDDARVLAGGQSLVPLLNMRLAQPRVLIDISRVAELNFARAREDQLAVGAATTQAQVEWRATLREEVPLLALAFPHIAHHQIRSRGTICGSICHADPSAELPLVLACLEGEVVLRSQRGARVVAAQDFFQGVLSTARAADELVEQARFPLLQDGTGYGFSEFAQRHGDFALVACAALVDRQQMRLAVGGVADRVQVKQWPLLSAADLIGALNDFAWDLRIADEPQVPAKYRRQLLRTLGQRAIEQALSSERA